MSHLSPERAFDITASDIPTVCGEYPYLTPRKVLYDKSLRLPRGDTEATLHGKKYEPIAIKKFIEKTGAIVTHSGPESVYKKHPMYTWLGATVDGIAKIGDEYMILEVKCPFKRVITPEVPNFYIGQIQTYMFIYGLARCAFVQYKPSTARKDEILEITIVDRDENYMALRLPIIRRFWEKMTCWTYYTRNVIVSIQKYLRAGKILNIKASLFLCKLFAGVKLYELQSEFKCPIYISPKPIMINEEGDNSRNLKTVYIIDDPQ
jgi:putative phage-type endonuclease